MAMSFVQLTKGFLLPKSMQHNGAEKLRIAVFKPIRWPDSFYFARSAVAPNAVSQEMAL